MGDPFSVSSMDELRQSTVGAPVAKAPPPGSLDTIGLSFRQAGSAPDWGLNQVSWEGRLLHEVQAELAKKGWKKPNYLPGDPRVPGQLDLKREVLDTMLAVERYRKADPNFLPDYAGVTNLDGLKEIAARKRREEFERTSSELEDAPTVPWLIGQVGHGAIDPISFVPVAGPELKGLSLGAQILRVGAREAIGNVAVSAVTEPLVRMDADQLGVERSATDTLVDLGVAGLTGGVLGAGGKGLQLAPRGIGERFFPDAVRQFDANRLGKQLLNIVEASDFDAGGDFGLGVKLHTPVPGYDPQRAEAAGTADLRQTVDAFEAAVPPDQRTPTEVAAVNALSREADVREASPFEPGIAGDEAHRSLLSQALDDLAAGKVTPGPALPAVPVTAATPAPVRVTARPARTQADIIRHVLIDLEGGAKVVNNRDGGGTTKFGITASNNPGVDVAKLTYDGAAEIARKKYWLPELDGHPAALQAVAFDAYYISGNRKLVRRILDTGEAGAGLALYRQHLASLAARPDKARFARPWNNRLDKLSRFIGGGEGDAPALAMGGADLPDRSAELAAARARGDAADAEFLRMSDDLQAAARRGREEPGVEAVDIFDAERFPVLRRELFDSDRAWVEAQTRFADEWMARDAAQSAGDGPPARASAVEGVGEVAAPSDAPAAAEGLSARVDVAQPYSVQFPDAAKSWSDALTRLQAEQRGVVPGVLDHPEIGRIDAVWGEAGTGASDGFGIAKIARFHPEVLADLPEIIRGMDVRSRSANRIRLESADHAAAVRLDWNGEKRRWLLTAYRKEAPPATVDERVAGVGQDGSPGLGADGDVISSGAGGNADPQIRAALDEVADLEAAAKASAFDDPRGSAARAQVESLEHDLRKIKAEPRAAMVAELQAWPSGYPDGSWYVRAADGELMVRRNAQYGDPPPRFRSEEAALKAAPKLVRQSEMLKTRAPEGKAVGTVAAADQPGFRLEAGEAEARGVRDILSELDEDEAAVAALRACMAPPKGS